MKPAETELTYNSILTPLGELTAIASQYGLFILTFQEEKAWIKNKLERFYKNAAFGKKHQNTLDITRKWLDRYFDAVQSERGLNSNRFSKDLPKLDLQGPEFSLNIWKLLLKIPFGQINTYGELSKKIMNINASRAVGQSVGNNPIAIMIPCHRVMGANNKLTGFRSGLHRKKWLLNHENYSID